MFKFISNMLFIVILFLLVTVMPLSTDILTINIFQPVIEEPVTEVQEIINYTLKGEFSSIDYTPEGITFSIASTGQPIPEDLLGQIEIELYEGDQLLSTTNLSELTPSVTSSTVDQMDISFSADSILNDLKQGEYNLVVKGIESSNISETLTTQISTRTFDRKALLATSDQVSGQLTMTLYYPTDGYEFLIPLSRRVPSPDNRSRTTLKELRKGPAENLGLIVGEKLWPYASRLSISGGEASVYIYTPEHVGFEDKFNIAVTAITYTLTSLDFIDRTNFYIDGSKKNPFGGVDLTQTFTPQTQNLVYLTYNKASDYMLLMPIDMAQMTTESITEMDSAARINLMWQLLSQSNAITTSDALKPIASSLQSPVASAVVLKSAELTDGILTLDVSADMLTAFNSNTDYIHQMMNSISKSFYSLDQVTEVYLKIDGASPTDYFGYDLSLPLLNPLYINMEPSL